jgi:endonuclease
MRVMIATCQVDYEGRLTAHLPMAPRLLMVKADGSVSVHADDRAYKPLNWMSPPCRLREEPGLWIVSNPKGETLSISIEAVHADFSYHLGTGGALQKDGVEAHLQELLAGRPDVLGEGMLLVRREYPTDIGPVDLLCRDAEGHSVAVEIKRRGDIDGVEQLARYLERLDLDGRLRPVRGIFAAQQIRPQAKVLAAARGIHCIEVDYDELRGAKAAELKLF